MTKRFASALGALFLFTGQAFGEDRPLEPLPAEAVATYRLQPGDVLEISVWKEEDLRREVLVRSDGGISFPLAGEFVVAGLTPTEVQAEIESRLQAFIPDSTASVAVLQINGNQIYVVGKVNRPGVYKFERPIDVMQVLSLAGGATEFAGLDKIKILRRDVNGTQRTYEFKYNAVARGRKLDQNIVLQSGDTLVVP
jgi:polysaccharide export outer membrane protein